MNYSAPTIKSILDELARDPLQVPVWHQLMMACFDQNDSDTFATYQLVIESVQEIDVHLRVLGATKTCYSKPCLPRNLFGLLVQISRNPENAEYMASLAKYMETDYDLPEHAKALYQRALFYNPDHPAARDAFEAYEAGGTRAHKPKTLESAPVHEVVSPPPPRGAHNFRRTVRITSRIKPELVAEADGKPLPKTNTTSAAPVVVDDPAEATWDRALRAASEGRAADALRNATAAALLPGNDTARAMGWGFVGFALHQKGLRGEALQAYAKAEKFEPTMTVFWFYQASAWQELGAHKEAVECYQRILQLDPGHAAAWINLGTIHYTRQHLDDAREAFLRAAAIQPGSTNVWDQLATVCMELGLETEAADACKRALEIDPDHVQASFHLGLLDFQNGRDQPAAVHFARARQNDPHYVPAACYLALLAMRGDDITRARALCESMRPDPDHTQLQAATWIELADTLWLQRDPEAALIACRSAVGVEPDKWPHRFLHGQILKSLERWAEAFEEFHAAGQMSGADYSCHMETGLCAYKLRRFQDAADAFARAATADPHDAESCYNHGVALEKLGKAVDAVGAYEEAVNRDPAHPAALGNLGLLCYTSKNYDRARSSFEKIIELRPDHVKAWATLGMIHFRQENWRDAVYAMQNAIDMDAEAAGPDLPGYLKRAHEAIDQEAAASSTDPASNPSRASAKLPRDRETGGHTPPTPPPHSSMSAYI